MQLFQINEPWLEILLLKSSEVNVIKITNYKKYWFEKKKFN